MALTIIAVIYSKEKPPQETQEIIPNTVRCHNDFHKLVDKRTKARDDTKIHY